MDFAGELDRFLPPDIPRRSHVITISACHLKLIADANERMNLTRIQDPREAAIKHVVDSVSPWRLFAEAKTVIDAGTGAGFPGIPLAAALPDTRFLLADSTQKKAKFVEGAIQTLQLPNAEVSSDRAEDILRGTRFDLITARAVAPVERALGYFAAGLKKGAGVLLYKGPDVEKELMEAGAEAKRRRVTLAVAMRYDLPEQLGGRTVIRISNQ